MKSTIYRNNFDEKYNLAKKFWRKVQFVGRFLAKDNLTNTNLLKRQFGQKILTKSKIQQIFVAKSTIRWNISIQL